MTSWHIAKKIEQKIPISLTELHKLKETFNASEYSIRFADSSTLEEDNEELIIFEINMPHIKTGRYIVSIAPDNSIESDFVPTAELMELKTDWM